jgi:hypothetical protein
MIPEQLPHSLTTQWSGRCRVFALRSDSLAAAHFRRSAASVLGCGRSWRLIGYCMKSTNVEGDR